MIFHNSDANPYLKLQLTKIIFAKFIFNLAIMYSKGTQFVIP